MKHLYVLFVLLLVGCSQTVEQPDIMPQEPADPCSDGVLGGTETDIDCGGSCAPCTDGKKCRINNDCVGKNCVNGMCIGASCTDGARNQGEEGVDCGGPCDACETCTDGILNQDEEKTDCGGVCPPCPVEDFQIAPDDLESLKQKLTQGTKATFLTNAHPAGVEVGGEHVFALGITNTLLEEKTFRVSITFKDAKDLQNNPIDVDKDTVLEWFRRNKFEPAALGAYEQMFVPVGLQVGENYAPGKKIVAGNYVFEAVVEYQKTSSNWEEHAKLPFTVRVK